MKDQLTFEIPTKHKELFQFRLKLRLILFCFTNKGINYLQDITQKTNSFDGSIQFETNQLDRNRSLTLRKLGIISFQRAYKQRSKFILTNPELLSKALSAMLALDYESLECFFTYAEFLTSGKDDDFMGDSVIFSRLLHVFESTGDIPKTFRRSTLRDQMKSKQEASYLNRLYEVGIINVSNKINVENKFMEFINICLNILEDTDDIEMLSFDEIKLMLSEFEKVEVLTYES